MKLLLQVTIVLAIVLGYFLIDYNAIYNSLRGEGEFVLQDKNCNLKESACQVTIQDGTLFELEVTPKAIPLMKPLTFTLKSPNQKLAGLKLHIYATNMMMGDYELPFTHMGNGVYKATGLLPTCPVGGMKWNADLEVEKINKVIGARFQFETDI